MSDQVYSVPGQTEGRKKTFLEWKSIDLSHELYPLHVGVMLTIIKVFFTLFLREHPANFQSESVSSAFNELCNFTL